MSGPSRIRPPRTQSGIPIPSYTPRQDPQTAKKYAAITASSLSDQEQLYQDIDKLKEAHCRELQTVQFELDEHREANERLRSATDRTVYWIEHLDNHILTFFQAHFTRTKELGAAIIALESKLGEVRSGSDPQLAAENSSLRRQIHDFEQEKAQLTEITLRVEQQITSLTEDRDLMSQQLDAKTARIAELEAQMRIQPRSPRSPGRQDEIEDENRRLILENESLRAQVEDQDDKVQEVESLVQTNETLMAKLAEYETIGQKLAQANSRIEKLTAENKELKQEVDRVKRHQFARELAVEELHVDEMRAEIASLSRANDDRDAHIGSLNQQLGDEQEKARRLSSELDDHEETIGRLSAQLDQIRRENAQLTDQLHSLELQMEEQRSLGGEAQQLLEENSRLKDRMHSLELRIEEHRLVGEEVERLRIATSEMENLRERNEQLKQRVNFRVEDQRDDLLRQITEMQQDNEALHNELSSLHLLQQRASELEQELKQARVMAEAYQRMGDNVQTQLSESRRINQVLTRHVQAQATPAKCSISCSPVKPVSPSRVDLSDEPDPAERDYARRFRIVNKSLAAAELAASERAAELQQLNSEFAPLHRQMLGLQRENRQSEERNAEHQSTIERLTTKYEEEAVRNSQLVGQIQKVSSELISVSRMYEEIKGRHKKLQTDLIAILHCTHEGAIIGAAISLANDRQGNAVVASVAGTARRIQQFAIDHCQLMDSFADEFSRRVRLVGAAASRIQSSVRLAKLSVGTASPSSRARKPMPPPKRTRDSREAQTLHDFSRVGKAAFLPPARPSHYNELDPLVKRSAFA
jgi:chromosome segregation ATPase